MTMSKRNRAEATVPEVNAGNIRLPVYLDNQATTPTDPRVVDAMLPYFTEKFGNPHSRTHAYGWEAEEAVERARRQVAGLIGADEKEIVFTSGATESNNLAIKGVAGFYGPRGKRHVITSAIEHKCVLECCERLREDGFDVTVLGVDSGGLIDLDELAAAIRDDTLLVSIMAVNNEIGVIEPIEEIGRLCHERGVLFHTDAAQAAGKIPLDVRRQHIDPAQHFRSQDVRAQGGGRIVCAPASTCAVEAVDGWRRAGAGPAFRHPGDAAGCRAGRGGCHRRREMTEEAARIASLRERLLAGLRAPS